MPEAIIVVEGCIGRIQINKISLFGSGQYVFKVSALQLSVSQSAGDVEQMFCIEDRTAMVAEWYVKSSLLVNAV